MWDCEIVSCSERKYWPTLEKYFESPNLVRPGASGRGPIKELGLFMEMMLNKGELNGTRIISERTVEELTSRQPEGLLDLTFNKTIDWGLGFMLDSKCHNRTYPYSFGPWCSADTFGHSGSITQVSVFIHISDFNYRYFSTRCEIFGRLTQIKIIGNWHE